MSNTKLDLTILEAQNLSGSIEELLAAAKGHLTPELMGRALNTRDKANRLLGRLFDLRKTVHKK